VPASPKVMSGYDELGWLTVTPGVEVVSRPETPVSDGSELLTVSLRSIVLLGPISPPPTTDVSVWPWSTSSDASAAAGAAVPTASAASTNAAGASRRGPRSVAPRRAMEAVSTVPAQAPKCSGRQPDF